MKRITQKPNRPAGRMRIADLLMAGFVLAALAVRGAFGLSASEILIVTAGDNAGSVRTAEYYCDRRGVPRGNVVSLAGLEMMADSISRADYERKIAGPIGAYLDEHDPEAVKIRCIVTTWGVPYKIEARRPSAEQQANLDKLRAITSAKLAEAEAMLGNLARLPEKPGAEAGETATKNYSRKSILLAIDDVVEDARARIVRETSGQVRRSNSSRWLFYCEKLLGKQKAFEAAKKDPYLEYDVSAVEKQRLGVLALRLKRQTGDGVGEKLRSGFYDGVAKVYGLKDTLAVLNMDIENLLGSDTHAAVDSELSMIREGEYPLNSYRPNGLKGGGQGPPYRTLMVSRLDGPGPGIARQIIDKSITAEKQGLAGIAYFDSRGKPADPKPGSYGRYDQSVRNAAHYVRSNTNFKTLQEDTPALFGRGQCPRAALYCGWYSLKKYIPAFEFVDGAVGYHIASWEAIDIRDPNSSQWVPAMLKAGISATFGAVAEPYLHAFPLPEEFFKQLIAGKTVTEAYYLTKPFNSWQLLIIADPLYRPFGFSSKSK